MGDDGTEITVPATVDDLAATADLFLRTGWSLAAAVWAWTYEGTNQHGEPGKKLPGTYSISEFASLGVRGIGSRPTVRRYRSIWQSAIDHGHASSVAPGDVIEIPDMAFGMIESAPEPKRKSDPAPDDRPEPLDLHSRSDGTRSSHNVNHHGHMIVSEVNRVRRSLDSSVIHNPEVNQSAGSVIHGAHHARRKITRQRKYRPMQA